MLVVDFPGAQRLVTALDAAVGCDCTQAITRQLCTELCKLIRDPEIRLPDCVFEAAPDRYARRELYRSNEHGYSVIAMTWGPGQGTAIHDHAGMWCVEGVWHGEIEVTPYEMVEQSDGRYRFEPRGTTLAGPGSAGSLIPPHEYHTIRNTSADAVAVSLHIYQAEMACCSKYGHRDGEWYARETTELATDKAA